MRYNGHFCGFLDLELEDKNVQLGPIYFQIGLPLNFNVYDEKNKFEVYISNDMAKI